MTTTALLEPLGDYKHTLPMTRSNGDTDHKLVIRCRRGLSFWLVAFTFTSLLLVLWTTAWHHLDRTLTSGETPFKINKTPLIQELENLWGQYSPYYTAGEYQNLPRGCSVSQVRIYE